MAEELKMFLENKFEGMYKNIVEYLKTIDDAVFQEKLNASTQSKLDFEKHITSEAKKFLKGKDGGVEDKIVYGWAIHFIDESAQVVTPKTDVKSKTKAETKTVKTKKVETKEKPAPAKSKKEKTKKDSEQLSFDFGV